MLIITYNINLVLSFSFLLSTMGLTHNEVPKRLTGQDGSDILDVSFEAFSIILYFSYFPQ